MKENLKEVASTIIRVTVAIVLLISFTWILTGFILANIRVPTSSMEDTIEAGSCLFGSRVHYKLGYTPKRGDIVVFYDPVSPDKMLIKRCIAVGGDNLKILYIGDGKQKVVLNGEDLVEPYIKEEMLGYDNLELNIPDDCYFFMGDNRNNSNDCRHWRTHYVHKNMLIANIWFQYYPEIKFFNQGDRAYTTGEINKDGQ